jgi:hypothetical protein
MESREIAPPISKKAKNYTKMIFIQNHDFHVET